MSSNVCACKTSPCCPNRKYNLIEMQMRMLMTLCLAWGFLIGSAVAQSGNCTERDSSVRPDCPGAIAFFRTFQSALKNNDRPQVADLISYPALTLLHKKPTHIRNRAQLLEHFDEIFDDRIRCALFSASDKDVWGNWRGFTVDGGAIWFDEIIPPGEHPDTNSPDYWKQHPFKVITINNDSDYACQKFSKPAL